MENSMKLSVLWSFKGAKTGSEETCSEVIHSRAGEVDSGLDKGKGSGNVVTGWV